MTRKIALLLTTVLLASMASAQVYSTAGGRLPQPRLPWPQQSTSQTATIVAKPQAAKQAKGEKTPVSLASGWYAGLGIGHYVFYVKHDVNNYVEATPLLALVGYMRPFLTTGSGNADLFYGAEFELGSDPDIGGLDMNLSPYVGGRIGGKYLGLDLRLQVSALRFRGEYEDYWDYGYDWGYETKEYPFFGVRPEVSAGLWLFNRVNLRLKYTFGMSDFDMHLQATSSF